MKIFVDENIPYARDFFQNFGSVVTFSGRDVTAEQIKSADVLLVRSITKVDAALLSLNSRIQFVGTATIGTDHIDLKYLAERNINFSSAPGCNKISVAEYVLSSLLVLAETQQFNLINKSVGIVGAGNTGTAVYEVLTGLGVTCKLYDPPLEDAGDSRQFCTFDEILSSDIISLHVPKISQGKHQTIHLFNHVVLEKLSKQQILVNACRGEIIDNEALLSLAKQNDMPTIVLDVWENEPNVNVELLPFVSLATPHIAGYSLDGKIRGTEMLYQALCQHLSVAPKLTNSEFVPSPNFSDLTVEQVITPELIKSLVHLIYDVRRDDALFRKCVNDEKGFDNMRKNYPERRELSTLTLNIKQLAKPISRSFDLQKVGFIVNEL